MKRLACIIGLACLPQAVTASEGPQRAAFVFGGVLTDADMADSAIPFAVDYEKNGILGGGVQTFGPEWRGITFGLEAGLAARAGKGSSVEVWAGPVARFPAVRLGDAVYLTPSFTAGLSAVTDTQPGREREQELRDDGNAALLFYLGPELNLSFREDAATEVFWRLHHRSGGGKTLGNMKGAMNANVIGVRYRF